MTNLDDLTISEDQVRAIVEKARRFDAKDVVTDPGDASNAADDGMLGVLEDHADDPVRQELATFIASMNEDEQIDLVGLAWLGRGDGDVEEWGDLRRQAFERHNHHTARYLLGMPLLGDYLEEGLSRFEQASDASRGRLP